MNIARSLCPLRRQNVGRKFFRNYKISAANYEATQTTQPQVIEEKFDFEDVKVFERSERRKPAIPAFMKDAFISIFNRDLLEYPEILNKEETQELDHRVDRLNSIFENPEKTQIEREKIVLDTGLYGGPVNLTSGGLAMNITERIRYLETIASDLTLGKKLSDHWVGLNAILQGIPEKQLQELIPKLINGQNTITLCIKETISTRVSQADFRTEAKIDSHGIWRINGEKICHNNSGYFLVLAMMEARRVSAFLVTPDAQGVQFEQPCIAFRDTPGIPLEQISEEALTSILGLSRLDTAVLSYSLLKSNILKTVNYVRGKFVTGKPLADASTIQARVGQALLSVYGAESMTYFTAGLLDGYYDPDADMEMAMCRSFTTDNCQESLGNLLVVPGLEAIDKSWSSAIDQFRNLALHDEIIDNINIYIALNGLQHAGKKLVTDVKQMRNPLFHPTYILKKVLADRHQESDNPKLVLHLAEHLHPTLKQPAENLEYCVLRLKYACETLLSRHGAQVVTAFTELDRLARAATLVLAMTAVLARASRSYCIGLRNAEIEMKLAACFVEANRQIVQKTVNDLVDGEYLNLDHFKIGFGKKILDTSTLLVEKPTERVFW